MFSIAAAQGFLSVDFPAGIVLLVSIVSGFLMVLVFRYTSDQKAIHIAKDHLKAHLLVVRLFQDQLPVVLRAYIRILKGTGRYLQLALKPLLLSAIPFTILIVQLDHSLGWMPLSPGRAFLVTARTDADLTNDVTLQLPAEMTMTAPALHLPEDSEVAWRVVAEKNGEYIINVLAGDRTYGKQVIVSPGLPRISPVRLRGRFWERMLFSAEPALPGTGGVQSIRVQYPPRTIRFLSLEWNWIWFFFVVSLIAGFFFKTVLGIEI